MKDYETLNQRYTRLRQDYEAQLINTEQLAGENSQRHAELKMKEDEIGQYKYDSQRQTRMREALQRKLKQVEDQKIEFESEKELLKGQISAMEKDIENRKKQADQDRKAIEDLIRERDILNKVR